MARILKTVQARNLPVTPEVVTALSNTGRIELAVRTLWPNEDEREFMRTWLEIERAHPIPFFPGTLETLESLYRYSILGIITQRDRKSAQQQVERLGSWFAFVIYLGDEEFKKPDPRAMDEALESYKWSGVKRKNITYVGDTLWDLEFARAAKINFYAVTSGGHYTREDFLNAGLDENKILNSVCDILRIGPLLN